MQAAIIVHSFTIAQLALLHLPAHLMRPWLIVSQAPSIHPLHDTGSAEYNSSFA